MSGTVFVVDDDTSLGESFARVIRTEGLPVRTFTSGEAFLESIDPNTAGSVVMDLRLPRRDGLKLLEDLRRRGSSMPVVFVSAHGDVAHTVRAMKAGAIDFLEKPVASEELLEAVRRAMQLDEELRRQEELRRDLEARLARLTQREFQIYGLVVRGRLNKQIAKMLGLSLQTVKLHRSRIMTKLAVSNLADLVHFADQLQALSQAAPEPIPAEDPETDNV
jgi:two-component system, LuxR family, response regulator FixJ